jgi:mRNA interferase MazF
MKRGEIWTVSVAGDYAGKPRPAVIVQDDAFDGTVSVTLCAFTTDPTEAPIIRLVVEPSGQNGLRSRSSLMVDKISTVPRSRLGSRVGELADRDMARLNQAALVFLGLATPRPRTSGTRS